MAQNIGVTKNSALLVATGNRELTPEDAKKFKSNRTGYEVSVDTTNNQLVLTKIAVKHDHSWTYALSPDQATIKATCENTDNLCDNINGGSVTITAPAHKTYGDSKSQRRS